MNDYVQMIKIGRNATDILRLPCVDGCHKEMDGAIVYHTNTINTGTAREGDLLCQRKNGTWWVEKGADNY